MSWGPTHASAQAPVMARKPGGWGWALFVLWLIGAPALFFGSTSLGMSDNPGTEAVGTVMFYTLVVVLLVAAVIGGVMGARRREFLYGRTGLLVAMILFAMPAFAMYAIGFALGHIKPKVSMRQRREDKKAKAQAEQDWANWNALDVSDKITRYSTTSLGTPWPGGVVGYNPGVQMPVFVSPRGATLVLGPPGAGKTTANIVPSVMAAPGACVSTSIKTDVLNATYRIRARHAGPVGTIWLFDPDLSEQAPDGVTLVQWSPLSAVKDWDSALLVGKSMSDAAGRAARGEGGENKGQDQHFQGRAADWLQVLLYAAHLKGEDIAKVATWAATAAGDDTVEEVCEVLGHAKDSGDTGAQIAWDKLQGLYGTPDRERGSIISTMVSMLRVYDSVKAREVARSTNFDPEAFVHSNDTLYITSRPDRQAAFGPLIGALLEQIRYATYDRHKRILTGTEPEQPHVTFVLDEAANTAPIPLDSIVSEAGGQGIHLVVGLQSITQAYKRWGEAGKGFLTMFPVKVVHSGTFDGDTTKALSAAAGKYDRQVTSHGMSTQYVGRYMLPVSSPSTQYNIQREEVLSQGDITNIPNGSALVWNGPTWELLPSGRYFEAPFWLEYQRWGELEPVHRAAIEAAPTQEGKTHA